jgi:hypothetical protein
MQRLEAFNSQNLSSIFLEKGELLLYKIAIYATVNLIDDAAMLAMIFT